MKKYNAHNSLLPFFIADQLKTGNSENRYNLCFSYPIGNEKSALLLVDTLQELIRSQAHLRQTFSLKKDSIMGHIHTNLPAEIHYYTSSRAEIAGMEQALIKEQHDLANKSLIRLNLIKLSDENIFIALFNIHHIIMDGNSLEQFILDINQLIAGKDIIKETEAAYVSKIAQEQPLQPDMDHPDFPNYLTIIRAIADDMTLLEDNSKSEIVYYTKILPSAVAQKLQITSQDKKLSVFNLLLLAWGLFVEKLTNHKGTLVSYPVNIREDKTIPGCFINTVTLPVKTSPDDTYSSLLHLLKNKTPFFKKIAKTQINHQIVQGKYSSFSSSNFAKPMDLVINGRVISSKAYAQIAHSNLSIKYRIYQDSFIFSADIVADLFPPSINDTLLLRFFHFLDTLLDNPNQSLIDVAITFPEEKKQILHEFNQTYSPFPKNHTLIDLFEEQVEKNPERVALVFEDIQYSYQELNEKSNQLAHYLINCHQVKPDDLIALLLDRNEHTLIAIIAVLKAGGAYVPIDLSYPQERINFILEDTQASMLLINEHHQDKLSSIPGFFSNESKLSDNNRNIIEIDSKKVQEELAGFEKTNIITADTSTNLAYVIYTSGTTGTPKGVMIEHKNVINTLRFLSSVYQKDTDNRAMKIAAFTSYAFDVSVSEFFIPLIQGDELHLLSNTLRRDILITSTYINHHQIDYLYLPPVLLANLPRIKYPSLKAIIYAGEPCNAKTALYWSSKTKLYNYYGPTETSIYATGLQLVANEVNLIGKPIANTTAYVLNAEKIPQPIGIIGELYIGGAGVAKGYLNQPQLTEERFISNPFQTEEEKIQDYNGRLYKTGDLVRWCPEGNLEYIGRNDFQVKIRGYRIELGEIETTLINYPSIKQAVVLVNNQLDPKDGEINHLYLVGYYVANTKIDEHELQAYLSLHLPDYMQPQVLVYLKQLPVNANGKLDRKALPCPEFTPLNHYVPPTNDQEQLVCDAFEKTLSLQKIGIEDDFFKLGGNSILAISLVASLQSNFNINVSDVFNLKTPKKIARDILFIKNNLRKNLELIRDSYQNKKHNSHCESRFQNKRNNYYEKTHHLNLTLDKHALSNILLTGATGFLGCNLLHTLINSTNYSIFLIVRADSDAHAFERVNAKYKFYFEHHLDHLYNKRLFVYAGFLDKKDLGLAQESYQTLVAQTDSIIHAAALTKHYGDYNTFYSANVQATINLLELSRLTSFKHFHYISTASVLNEGYLPNCDYFVFTEDDEGDNLEGRTNIYVKTKYEGETIALKYRKLGVKSSIYRIGNLAYMASNHKAQENIDDNAFFTRLDSLIRLKMIAPEVGIEEISPADLTAEAIIKLFDLKCLENEIFHVFNPQKCNIATILAQDDSLGVKLVTINQFINAIISQLDKKEYNESLELFLLHRRWLNEQQLHETDICILQDKTQYILKYLGFEWHAILPQEVIKYIKRKLGHG